MRLTRTILFCIIALFTADFVQAEEPFTAEVYRMGSDRKVLLYRKPTERPGKGPLKSFATYTPRPGASGPSSRR